MILLYARAGRRQDSVHELHRRHSADPVPALVLGQHAKQLIGKECIIYTITSNDSSISGVIKEVCDGGLIIERKSGEKEIINLDFITRIREYPRKKNGKKKEIVLD